MNIYPHETCKMMEKNITMKDICYYINLEVTVKI